MRRPRLLDLFSNAGGATRGYQLAGFEVVGVDIDPQPDYCGDEFHQADALTFPLDGFDAIHASPPCQSFTALLAPPCDHSWQTPRFPCATNRTNLRRTVEVGVWRIPLEVQQQAMGIDMPQ